MFRWGQWLAAKGVGKQGPDPGVDSKDDERKVDAIWANKKLGGTVDGWNPAPPGMYETL